MGIQSMDYSYSMEISYLEFNAENPRDIIYNIAFHIKT